MSLRIRHDCYFILFYFLFTLYHCTNMTFAPEYYEYMMGHSLPEPPFPRTGFIGLVWCGVPQGIG